MPFAVSLDDAADAITRLVTETPLDQPGGRFFRAGQLEETSPDARDAAKAARFFELAEELLAAHLAGE